MAIITISRGTLAGGEELARLLGARLGYRTVSRELLYERVRDVYGLSLEQAAQIMERTPSTFDPMAKNNRRLLIALQASLCELLQDDDTVYHGYAGHLLLPHIAHVLRVRVIAPRKMRVAMAMKRERISEFDAGRRIDQVDGERTRWVHFFYGAEWADPSCFDVVLHLERTSLEDAAEVVAQLSQLPSFNATDASRQAMADLLLTSRVRAALVLNPTTADLDIDVEARSGVVRLRGLTSPDHGAQALEIVGYLEGVSRVETSLD